MKRKVLWLLGGLLMVATAGPAWSNDGDVVNGLRYQNFSFPLGSVVDVKRTDPGLRGEFCNDRDVMLNELFVTVHALSWSGEEQWTTPLYLDGIGPRQCRGFFQDVYESTRVEKFSVSAAEPSWKKPLPTDNLNTSLECRGLAVQRNNLTGTVCNRSGQSMAELFLKIFALGFGKQVLWTETVNVGGLENRACTEISQPLSSPVPDPKEWAVLPVDLTARGPYQEGQMLPGLEYRIIRWDNGFLVGEFRCSSVPAFGYVNLYAMSPNETIMARLTVKLPQETSEAWQRFAAYYNIRNRRPDHWRFSFSSGGSGE